MSLVVSAISWVITGLWVWLRGWQVQRHYLAQIERAALSRTAVTWTSALVGAAFLIATQERPGTAAVVVVSMVGVISSWVDIRTHRLPSVYTRVMFLGVLVGIGTFFLTEGTEAWERVLFASVGALLWGIPFFVAYKVHTGVGFGDVKLAPVMGALVGMLGIEPALAALVFAFISAGFAALWLLITGSTSANSRMAMGPWMLGAAILAHLFWDAVPKSLF